MSCNNFCPTLDTITGSGGMSFSGSAEVSSTIPEGGWEFAGSANYDGEGVAYGLTAWWLLDELGAGIANEYQDLRGFYHGTGGSGAATWTPSRVTKAGQRAQEFDGEQYIDVSTTYNATIKSLSCWLRIDSWHRDRAIYGKPGLKFGYSVLRQPYLEIIDAEGTRASVYGSSLNQLTWHHVAATWTPGEALRMYVDGSLAATSSTTIETLATGSGAYIGRHENANYAEAAILDLRLYPDARPLEWWQTEVEAYCPGLMQSQGSWEEPAYGMAPP